MQEKHNLSDSDSISSASSIAQMKASNNNDEVDGEKQVQAREGWGGKMDFLLTCIGYAVGLGNIWRFPYLCYKSGGGAFFIPYVTFLLLCGMPLFFMEVSYGQFSSLSPVAIWRVSPLFKGVGIGMLLVSAIVCIYYNVIVAWTLYYLYQSFRAVLPWSHCNNDWNSDRCVDDSRTILADTNKTTNISTTIFMSLNTTTAEGLVEKVTKIVPTEVKANKSIAASEEFWNRHVLDISDGIENLGEMRWELFVCLAVAWVFVFLCLFKGVKVLGKVMHFAAVFPYLVLTILLVRGITLPGAKEGIQFYIIPQWHKLADYTVWGDAALQIFYSVGPAWGGIITMASYNRFNNNIYRDAMIVPLINCGTSLFAGFVIFAVLGFMAHEMDSTIEKIVTQGPGLVFVAYPEALAKLPVSPLWAVLFFLMFFTIGLDSQFGMFETILSGLIDEFPQALRSKKTLITAVACTVEFFLGLPCITQGGIYVLQVMDWYCASFSLMLISLTECVALAWIYGADRLIKDLELMIGFKPSNYWKIMWKYITPGTILAVWLFSVITLSPVTYGTEYHYPGWAIFLGWMMGILSLIPIPVMAILQISKTSGTFMERVKKSSRPEPTWGPAKEEDRKRYLQSLGEEELDAVVSMGGARPFKETGVYNETTISFLPNENDNAC